MSTTKREPAKQSAAGRQTKRSIPKQSASHPSRLKNNIRIGREPAHQSAPRHTT
jgi:hypothetical protein